MRRWQINSSNTCWAVICTPSSSLLDTKVKQTRIRKLTTHLLLALLRALEPSAWEHLSVGAGGKMGTFWDRVINCLAIFTAAFESSLTTSNKFAYNSCETINSPKMAFSAVCRQPQCSLYMSREGLLDTSLWHLITTPPLNFAFLMTFFFRCFFINPVTSYVFQSPWLIFLFYSHKAATRTGLLMSYKLWKVWKMFKIMRLLR